MLNGKSFLAVIPARGGSKRLPRKNKLDLGGRALIEWTIEAAVKCDFIDEVLVSTDDEEVVEISKLAGASVPFIRPAELSGDTSSSYSVVEHAIDFYTTNEKRSFDFVILLQPTSPFRSSRDILSCARFLFERNADAVVSICEVEHSPLWSNILPQDQSMNNFLKQEFKNIRGQDLPTYYRLNGAMYICKIDRLLEDKSFMLNEGIYGYVMPRLSSIDIDTEVDFLLAKTVVDNGLVSEYD